LGLDFDFDDFALHFDSPLPSGLTDSTKKLQEISRKGKKKIQKILLKIHKNGLRKERGWRG
jgi:hypothetical protein